MYKGHRSLILQQQIDEADLNALDTFLPSDAIQRKTLAEIIFEKLQDAEDMADEHQETKRVDFDLPSKGKKGIPTTALHMSL
jgi:hypothetical protein